MKKIKVGYLDIPTDYFDMDKVNRETVCLVIMENILTIIDRNFPKHINRFDILETLLESSIQSNVEEETYEVAQVLKDIQDIVNEQRSREVHNE